MKAVCIARPGGPEVLEYLEVPTPQPKPNQVLVKAHTIGVNMPDVLVRRGVYPWMPPLPAIVGIEMTGTVAAVGAEVRDLRLGAPVYVSARELPHRCGGYAEYIAADVRALLPLPEDADLELAAALSGYQVAWHLMNSVTRGFTFDSVLVTAAAGGIGSACVQLARAAGKRVVALTSSKMKAGFALAQGASAAFCYDDADVKASVLEATEGRGADLVLDAVAGSRFPTLFEYTAPLGLVVLYGFLTGWPDSAAVFDAMRMRVGRSPALRLFSMHTLDGDATMRRQCSEILLRYFASGAARPAIYQRLPLAHAARAHAMLESGVVMGKLLLKP
ncbi:MAG: quinone oxidoreductase family protein [Betaproteobacteria bacterium]